LRTAISKQGNYTQVSTEVSPEKTPGGSTRRKKRSVAKPDLKLTLNMKC